MQLLKTLARRGLASLAIALSVLLPVGQAHAQAMSDYLENALLDHVFRGIALTAPSAMYVGLGTAACSDSSVGTEVSTSGTGYARVSITPAGSAWTNTQNSGTGASSGTGGQISNAAAITFGTPTANWGTVTHFFLISSASGAGNIYICQALTTSKSVNSGDAAPSFAIGALTITFQ